MAGWVDVNDAGVADARSGNTIGGLTFGSAGSGRHSTGAGAGSIPPWLIAGLVVGVVLAVVGGGRSRK